MMLVPITVWLSGFFKLASAWASIVVLWWLAKIVGAGIKPFLAVVMTRR